MWCWDGPDLLKDMQEILRVLKSDGTLMVIAESYKNRSQAPWRRHAMKLLRSADWGVDAQRELFSAVDLRYLKNAQKDGFA
jgi:hypothetical protein